MHIQERCVIDGKMSEDFLAVASSKGYVVQCSTSIGWVTVDEPEYRNSVSYRTIREDDE